ncbi:MAG: copper ion binding protein [Mariniphaga sp.]|nr:copper ion binding protein [Mariniphaga sp.]
MRKLVFILGIFFLVSCGGQKKQNEGHDSSAQVALTEVTLNVGGMHCDMCVASIEKGVGAVEGVEFVNAELSDSTTVVKFNETETNLAQITQAIEKRGYRLKE